MHMSSIVDLCPGYHRNRSSYSETIDTGAISHSNTKKSPGVDTGMVHVTLPFDNFTPTPNGIIVKYPDGNISQATLSALLKIPFLPIEASRVRLFGTISSGLLLSIGKTFDAGCTYYLNYIKVYVFSQGKIVLQGVISSSTTFLLKVNKDHNQYKEDEEFQSLNAVIDNPFKVERIKFYHTCFFCQRSTHLTKQLMQNASPRFIVSHRKSFKNTRLIPKPQ